MLQSDVNSANLVCAVDAQFSYCQITWLRFLSFMVLDYLDFLATKQLLL